ncbi:unnamed protein product [Peronospora effusa]|uniref:RRM domain-containing protein n=1 Tax=Peronospora farinosa TaxID=134698 RepID=A0AAV0ST45_9STRA|nr:unnamed protein product [Peronospora farinosa]CAI5702200.1 unnamed protein product [Peronospora effusa]CAI5707427.1 unnamed protein product [Peronospora farinosa]
MSSILASLDMSLDDLIARKKTKATNPSSRPAKINKDHDAAGPIRGGRRRNNSRNQPYSRSRGDNDDDMDVDLDDVADSGNNRGGKKRSVVIKKPVKGGKKGGSSILSRLGGKDAASSGTKILVKNLKFDILEEEVRELFGTVGEVSKAEIVYDRSGRSKGIARVWFSRRSDADKAIKQYDGRTLDGQPMQITLDSDKNVRNGLFGTALNSDDKNVKFKVSFGGHKDNEQAKGRRNRRRGRGNEKGTQGVRESGPSKSAEELDNEMDSYMKDA